MFINSTSRILVVSGITNSFKPHVLLHVKKMIGVIFSYFLYVVFVAAVQ